MPPRYPRWRALAVLVALAVLAVLAAAAAASRAFEDEKRVGGRAGPYSNARFVRRRTCVLYAGCAQELGCAGWSALVAGGRDDARRLGDRRVGGVDECGAGGQVRAECARERVAGP